MTQGLVHDINATDAFGLRESKSTYGLVSTPIHQGWVENKLAKDTKMVLSLTIASGLVSNKRYGKTCMLKNYTHGRKAKRTTSGAKKTTVADEANHAVAQLLTLETEAGGWVSTLASLTLLKVANKHAAALNKKKEQY